MQPTKRRVAKAKISWFQPALSAENNGLARRAGEGGEGRNGERERQLTMGELKGVEALSFFDTSTYLECCWSPHWRDTVGPPWSRENVQRWTHNGYGSLVGYAGRQRDPPRGRDVGGEQQTGLLDTRQERPRGIPDWTTIVIIGQPDRSFHRSCVCVCVCVRLRDAQTRPNRNSKQVHPFDWSAAGRWRDLYRGSPFAARRRCSTA